MSGCHLLGPLTLVFAITITSSIVGWANGGDKVYSPHYYSIHPGSNHTTMGATWHRAKRSLSNPNRTPYTRDEKTALLNIHNKLRGLTKAADVLMMEWDRDLEREAQRWADRCDFNHPKERRQVGRFRSVGQNLYVSTYKPEMVTEPIQLWYDEIKDYTYSTNIQCRPDKMCGHYTQVIWAKSESVGCAIKYCDRLTSVSSFDKGYLVVCEYGPAGNIIGRYPYQRGDACSKCPDKYKHCVRNLCSVRPFIGGLATRPRPVIVMVMILGTLALIAGGSF